jgi:glucose/arabinose dehydrogenase/sugar lactone lactonase YvrE
MTRAAWLPLVFCLSLVPARGADEAPKPLVGGLKDLRAVTAVPSGKVYVATGGEGGGAVLVIDGGKAVPFAEGPADPRALVPFGDGLFVADKDSVRRIDRAGKSRVIAAANAFPTPPRSLSGIAADELGRLYVTDAGDGKEGGAVYQVTLFGKVTLVTDTKRAPALKSPRGVVMDGLSFLLVIDGTSGELLRVKAADGTAEKLADGFGAGGALAWDRHGRLYLADAKGGRLSVIPRPGDKPVSFSSAFSSPVGLALDPAGKSVLVADAKAGTLTALPAAVPGQPVDETPLPVAAAVAFPDLTWTGWNPEERGRPNPLRPIALTHAGDGSNRVFVATEQGVIHVFPNDQKSKRTKMFLDIQSRVRYLDSQNEEGFLGLAFHPDYKKNGEFFVFYTDKKQPGHQNVVSRFRVSKDDPDAADPSSEEELLRIEHKDWNHDGGTLVFGPDGYLYIAVGDGGSANDPHKNGQNLNTLLAKVLRIDVNHKGEGRKYAIPKDNPFADRKDARPEIWAYGLRNPWRMAFDRRTGKLWTSDVGQNLYEEIDILTAGGNYGWSVREGLHPFSVNGTGPRKDLIDPIWEYHHDTGKSLTGGTVYRGKRLPELDGYYLYADYVVPRIWGLRYDEGKGRVVANRPIRDPNLPVMSFGEDETGEVYFMTYSGTGKGIYWFVPAK